MPAHLCAIAGILVARFGTIIHYAQNSTVAKIVLQDCEVSSSSNIQVTKTYDCDEDSFIVDERESPDESDLRYSWVLGTHLRFFGGYPADYGIGPSCGRLGQTKHADTG